MKCRSSYSTVYAALLALPSVLFAQDVVLFPANGAASVNPDGRPRDF